MRRPSRLSLARPAHALLLSLARGEDPATGLYANYWHPNQIDVDRSNLPAAISGPIWEEALGLAARHGLAPLLHEAAQAGGLPWLPETIRRGLREARIAELSLEEKRGRALNRVLAALSADPLLPVLLIKGAASARTIYPLPELRPRSDLDLLIAPADRTRALAMLELRGYQQHAKTRGTREDEAGWHERTLVDPIDSTRQIDLHFALAQPERHRLKAERLLAASVREPALGAGARVLPAEEAALLCAHAIAIHELAVPLISLCDLARLISRCDLEKLSALAKEVRLSRVLHVAVELLAALGPPASRSSSILAKADPCAAFSLCGARVEPGQLALLLKNSPLRMGTRRLLRSAAASYDLSRAPLPRTRQLWRKALFIDSARDAARFAAAHALSTLRRFARPREKASVQ